jgi:hypothetical protein
LQAHPIVTLKPQATGNAAWPAAIPILHGNYKFAREYSMQRLGGCSKASRTISNHHPPTMEDCLGTLITLQIRTIFLLKEAL